MSEAIPRPEASLIDFFDVGADDQHHLSKSCPPAWRLRFHESNDIDDHDPSLAQTEVLCVFVRTPVTKQIVTELPKLALLLAIARRICDARARASQGSFAYHGWTETRHHPLLTHPRVLVTPSPPFDYCARSHQAKRLRHSRLPQHHRVHLVQFWISAASAWLVRVAFSAFSILVSIAHAGGVRPNPSPASLARIL